MSTEAAKAGVFACIEQAFSEEIQFLQRMAALPSTRGNTNPVQALLAADMRNDGLSVVEEPIDVELLKTSPFFAPVDWSYEGLVNVVGRLPGAGGGGRSLLLNGHVDVVPAQPLDHWKHDPWAGEIEQGRMYGRGTADMKGGIAAILFALKAIRAAGYRLKGDVLVQSVIDEEGSGNGTLSCLMRGHLADAAIIPEPFGMKVVSATVGVQWCRIRVSGRGAHAEGAARALSALDKSLYLIAALRQLEREWNSRNRRHPLYRRHRHPINFNVGMVQAGEWTSSVAQASEVNVRLSCFPGESTEFLRTRAVECIGEAVRRDPWLNQNPPEVTFFGMRAEPAIFPTTGPFYTALATNHQIASGLPLQSAAVSASMDNRHFVEYGIPNFSYGPIGGNLHSSDEWLDLESLKTCTKTLAGVILDWCEVASKDTSDEGSIISLRQEA